jgi:hypothetical protein
MDVQQFAVPAPEASVMDRVAARRRRRRRRLAVVVVGGVVLGCASAALADVSGSDGGGTVTVTVSSSTSIPGSDGGAGAGVGTSGDGSGPACTWTELSTDGVPGLAGGGPGPGNWYIVTCPGEATGFEGSGLVWVPDGTSTPTSVPVVDPSSVAAQAAASMALPVPVIEHDPSPDAVVNLPTWLWIDPAVWHGYTATAAVSGVSATATAVPQSVTWSMGDGESVVCDDPGTAYRTDEPASVQHTDCQHTYVRSSAGERSPDGNPDHAAFTVTATITWSVSWTSSVPGAGGSLAPQETSSSVPLRVVQVQSVDAVQ